MTEVDPQKEHRNRHRQKTARLWLVLMFIALRAADAMLLYFTFHPLNPVTLLRGFVFGSILFSTMFILAIWQRHGWARYAAIGFHWCIVTPFSLAFFSVIQRQPDFSGPALALVLAVTIYIACNVVLIRSRKIRHLANQA